MKLTHARLAATIAYSMDAAGFTPEERARTAEVFASDLRITGIRRRNFLADCQKASEREIARRIETTKETL